MPRLFLIHWNAGEAEAMAAPLRLHGMEVTVEADDGGRAAKAIHATPPDAVIISLARLPSHGRAVAEHLLTRRTTRDVPLLFVGGTPEAAARVRQLVPNAKFIASAELPDGVVELFPA